MGGDKRGFTIIETMLYLAVTGLLAVGVLASAGYAINVQRYRDAVDSLVSYLQSQYDETVNVQNDHANNLVCASNHIVDGSGTNPGTSDCVILGKFVQTTDGKTFSSATVYGTLTGATTTSDVQAVQTAAPFTSTDTVAPSTYTVEWSAQVVKPKTTTPEAPLNILIVRSPASGAMMTFVGHSAADTPLSLTSATPADTLLCIDSAGFYNGDTMGALLSAGSTNAAGVKRISGGGC